MSTSVTLIIAVLSSMPMAFMCGLASVPLSLCSRFGPKITARFAAVILFPGIWKKEKDTSKWQVFAWFIFRGSSLVCSSPTSSSFVPMASWAKRCTVCKRPRRRSSVSQLQGGSRYRRCCRYWSCSAPLNTERGGRYRRHMTLVRVCVHVLTIGVQEGRVELSGQQRIGHVSEELFKQSGHIVNTVLLFQLDIHPHVKILPQLGTRTRRGKEGKMTNVHTGQTGQISPGSSNLLQNRISQIISSALPHYFYIPALALTRWAQLILHFNWCHEQARTSTLPPAVMWLQCLAKVVAELPAWELTCRTLFLELPTRKIPTVCKPKNTNGCRKVLSPWSVWRVGRSASLTVSLDVAAAPLQDARHLSVDGVEAQFRLRPPLGRAGLLQLQLSRVRELQRLQQARLTLYKVRDGVHWQTALIRRDVPSHSEQNQFHKHT